MAEEVGAARDLRQADCCAEQANRKLKPPGKARLGSTQGECHGQKRECQRGMTRREAMSRAAIGDPSEPVRDVVRAAAEFLQVQGATGQANALERRDHAQAHQSDSQTQEPFWLFNGSPWAYRANGIKDSQGQQRHPDPSTPIVDEDCKPGVVQLEAVPGAEQPRNCHVQSSCIPGHDQHKPSDRYPKVGPRRGKWVLGDGRGHVHAYQNQIPAWPSGRCSTIRI